METDIYCDLEKEKAHPKAQALMTEDFFWDIGDELAPFGSDEGFEALSEFREWRLENPDISVGFCIAWIIESVGEFDNYEDYNEENLVHHEKILQQINDPDFDDQQYIFTLDTTIIATALGQLVDEGLIEEEYKYYVQVAINRLRIWADLQNHWDYRKEYIHNLDTIEQVLESA